MPKLLHEICASLDIDSQTALKVARKSGAIASDNAAETPETEIGSTVNHDQQLATKEVRRVTQTNDVDIKQQGNQTGEIQLKYTSVAAIVRAYPEKTDDQIRAIAEKQGLSCGSSTISVARCYIKKHPASGQRRLKTEPAAQRAKHREHPPEEKVVESGAAAPEKTDRAIVEAKPKSDAEMSALEILAAAAEKFREGMALMAKAKVKFLLDADRLQTLAPFEAGIQAAVRSALAKKK